MFSRILPDRKTLWAAGALLILSALLALGTNALRPDGISLKGDWSPEARLATPDGRTLAIPLAEARSLFENGGAVFLDARPALEYAEGHIQGALSLPAQEFDVHFDRLMDRIPDTKTLIAYCDGESCELSKDLAKTLLELGFPNVRVLINGWTIWKNDGLPVEAGK